MSAEFMLVGIALICFVASLLPQVPEKYTLSVGGLLLSIALLITLKS